MDPRRRPTKPLTLYQIRKTMRIVKVRRNRCCGKPIVCCNSGNEQWKGSALVGTEPNRTVVLWRVLAGKKPIIAPTTHDDMDFCFRGSFPDRPVNLPWHRDGTDRGPRSSAETPPSTMMLCGIRLLERTKHETSDRSNGRFGCCVHLFLRMRVYCTVYDTRHHIFVYALHTPWTFGLNNAGVTTNV